VTRALLSRSLLILYRGPGPPFGRWLAILKEVWSAQPIISTRHPIEYLWRHEDAGQVGASEAGFFGKRERAICDDLGIERPISFIVRGHRAGSEKKPRVAHGF
jgi:hypothetical protein